MITQESYFNAARKAMVESQLRPNKVIDEQVITAFAEVPREAFLPKSLREIAYIDEDIILSGGRFVMEPMVLARLVQAMGLQRRSTLLVVGCGTGYGAAICSYLVNSVIAIESRANMVERAEQVLADLDISNVAVVKSKLAEGFPAEAPFDAILVEGALETVPSRLLDQLAPDGVLAGVWRPAGSASGEASIWQASADSFVRTALFTAQIPGFEEFREKPKFVF